MENEKYLPWKMLSTLYIRYQPKICSNNLLVETQGDRFSEVSANCKKRPCIIKQINVMCSPNVKVNGEVPVHCSLHPFAETDQSWPAVWICYSCCDETCSILMLTSFISTWNALKKLFHDCSATLLSSKSLHDLIQLLKISFLSSPVPAPMPITWSFWCKQEKKKSLARY